MGLDMFLFRAQKPRLTKQPTYKELKDKKLTYFVATDEGLPDELRDLKPFLVTATITMQHVDVEKIKKEYQMHDTPQICGMGSARWLFCSSHPDDKIVAISDQAMSQYMVDKETKLWVTRLIEVGTWCKEYDLQEKIHEVYQKPVLNTGYHVLTPAKLKKVYACCEAHGLEIFEWDGKSKLFYHEWY